VTCSNLERQAEATQAQGHGTKKRCPDPRILPTASARVQIQDFFIEPYVKLVLF